MRMFLLQGDEFFETPIFHVEFRIEDGDLPGNVAYSDESVDNVRAQIIRNVVDTIAAYVRTVDGPVTEVTDYPWGL